MGTRWSIYGAASEGVMQVPAHPTTVQYTNYVYPKGEVCPARHEMAFAKVFTPGAKLKQRWGHEHGHRGRKDGARPFGGILYDSGTCVSGRL